MGIQKSLCETKRSEEAFSAKHQKEFTDYIRECEKMLCLERKIVVCWLVHKQKVTWILLSLREKIYMLSINENFLSHKLSISFSARENISLLILSSVRIDAKLKFSRFYAKILKNYFVLNLVSNWWNVWKIISTTINPFANMKKLSRSTH